MKFFVFFYLHKNNDVAYIFIFIFIFTQSRRVWGGDHTPPETNEKVHEFERRSISNILQRATYPRIKEIIKSNKIEEDINLSEGK